MAAFDEDLPQIFQWIFEDEAEEKQWQAVYRLRTVERWLVNKIQYLEDRIEALENPAPPPPPGPPDQIPPDVPPDQIPPPDQPPPDQPPPDQPPPDQPPPVSNAAVSGTVHFGTAVEEE
jgi:hypothetical protein